MVHELEASYIPHDSALLCQVIYVSPTKRPENTTASSARSSLPILVKRQGSPVRNSWSGNSKPSTTSPMRISMPILPPRLLRPAGPSMRFSASQRQCSDHSVHSTRRIPYEVGSRSILCHRFNSFRHGCSLLGEPMPRQLLLALTSCGQLSQSCVERLTAHLRKLVSTLKIIKCVHEVSSPNSLHDFSRLAFCFLLQP